MSETVKLVIEIPSEVYELLKNFDWESLPKEKFDELASYEYAIAHGTPLPKGHGRLIDADAYKEEMLNSREFDFFKRLDMQPTIIKADKGESEERNDKRGIFADCKATSVSL